MTATFSLTTRLPTNLIPTRLLEFAVSIRGTRAAWSKASSSAAADPRGRSRGRSSCQESSSTPVALTIRCDSPPLSCLRISRRSSNMSSMSQDRADHRTNFFGTIDPALALEAITQIHLALEPPQLLEGLIRATTAIGATASIYTLTIPENRSEPSSFSLFACHPALAQRQYRLGPLSNHPWFRCARERSAPATDQQVRPTCASDDEAIDLARQYGFKSCLIVPTSSGVDPARIEMAPHFP